MYCCSLNVDVFAFFRCLSIRTVTGGAAGETEGAFAVQNACTMLWSNEKSWVRPRSIKYVIDIVAVKD